MDIRDYQGELAFSLVPMQASLLRWPKDESTLTVKHLIVRHVHVSYSELFSRVVCSNLS